MTRDPLVPLIREIPDFPRPGILFRDLTPLLAEPAAFSDVLARLEALALPMAPQAIAGIEARGFIFGGALAQRLGLGFIPLRKPGKLPGRTLGEPYALEYGEGRLEMHADAFPPGRRILILDDLLATGGTAAAAARLVQRAGGLTVGVLFVVELAALHGRSRLGGLPVESLLLF